MRDPGSGLGGSGDDVKVGRAPPSDAEFYLQWGKENAKDSIKNASTALGQLLTLSTALLGGSIAFWDKIPVTLFFKLAVVAALLLTVIVCLFAAMPAEGTMSLDSAADIQDHMRHVLAFKKRRLFVAKWSLTCALVSLFVGLLIKICLSVGPIATP